MSTDPAYVDEAAVEEAPLTTVQKLALLRDEIETMHPDEMPDDARSFVTNLQMLAGTGVDLFAFLVPDDPTEADVMIDKAISLLLQIRGDNLPPFRAPAGVRIAQELT